MSDNLLIIILKKKCFVLLAEPGDELDLARLIAWMADPRTAPHHRSDAAAQRAAGHDNLQKRHDYPRMWVQVT